jgi:hypothetical protein
MALSCLFSCQNHDELTGIWFHDGGVLIYVGDVLGDAFCESVEQVAEEDVVGGVQHDLHLEVDVNVVKCEPDIVEGPCISVIIELAASIFNARSTCRLLLSFSQIEPLFDSWSPGYTLP